MAPQSPLPREVQQTLDDAYAVRHLTVISSSKISKKVTQVLSLLEQTCSSLPWPRDEIVKDDGVAVLPNGAAEAPTAPGRDDAAPEVDATPSAAGHDSVAKSSKKRKRTETPPAGEDSTTPSIAAATQTEHSSTTAAPPADTNSPNHAKPMLLRIEAKAPVASKLITVVEIAKRHFAPASLDAVSAAAGAEAAPEPEGRQTRQTATAKQRKLAGGAAAHKPQQTAPAHAPAPTPTSTGKLEPRLYQYTTVHAVPGPAKQHGSRTAPEERQMQVSKSAAGAKQHGREPAGGNRVGGDAGGTRQQGPGGARQGPENEGEDDNADEMDGAGGAGERADEPEDDGNDDAFFTTLRANTIATVHKAHTTSTAAAADDDDDAAPTGAAAEEEPTRTIPVLTVFLSTRPVPALRALFREQVT